ncbi:MAG: ATP-binding protein [Terrimesophilobacter sp.]
MEPIAKARDRLLRRSTRALGLSGTAIAALCLSIPGLLEADAYLVVLPLLALMAFCQFQVGRSRSIIWVLLGLVAGIAILVVAQLPLSQPPSDAAATALVPVAGLALAAFAVVLTRGTLRIAILAVSVVAAAALTELATGDADSVSPEALAVVFGWLLCTVLGYWLGSSVPRAARRIFSIGRAHRAERQASETEAQRRQSARLLHDTVLATLTLLAHSGVGVATSAMQQQAGDDARLLRQLRLGATPKPQSSGSYTLEAGAEIALGTTLESVKQRFGRMGLEVSWHGTGQVLLPSEVLDAFLLALAECLENVRRHSGVTDAHVTITDDETTVRAMVTDAGVGFDLSDVDAARMGLKESVMGRLNEVGGRARLFSSAGAGTTVVLEVPK